MPEWIWPFSSSTELLVELFLSQTRYCWSLTRLLVFIFYEAHDIYNRLLKNKYIYFFSLNIEKNNYPTQQEFHSVSCTLYINMRKDRVAGVQLENHVVSGIAYGIAQTAAVCKEYPDIVSTTDRPWIFLYALLASTYHIPVHKKVPGIDFVITHIQERRAGIFLSPCKTHTTYNAIHQSIKQV